MFDLKVSKQTRSEASKNKLITKRASNINKLGKSKSIISQIGFQKLQKSTLQRIHVILN